MVIDYGTAPSGQLALRLGWADGLIRVTLTGGDGVSLAARELVDESLRGPTIRLLADIAYRWGIHADHNHHDCLWIEFDLGGAARL